ncbi:Hypothetical protein NCS54_01022300 [Fusarium falciforme]|uniref:Hypothetical protein n=1 Tax=Fusarium falciforme TaxID=195108 RepID=UPI002301B9B6|nr:Hypothetical protein NCS54_01022300 [Fusarium falciforme]WAO92705.1 Hypothetical protein NCS54_01022300 [Fusarium falciforme]
MSSTEAATAMKTLTELYNSPEKGIMEEQMLYVSRHMMPKLIAPLPRQMGITNNTSTPVAFFDNACGSGVLTHEIQQILPKDVLEKSTFLSADNAEGMVNLSKKRVGLEGWVNIEVKKLDATNTGLPENSFTHVGLGLALHIIPDPDAVLADAKRILKPGGIFGATTFHKSNVFWQPDMRSAFESFPFEAPFLKEVKMQMHNQGDWTDPQWIEKHLKSQGFVDVQVTTNPGRYHIKNAEEYVLSFGMMLAWLMNAAWSEETRRQHPVEEVRELLRKHLEEKYEGKGWDVEWKVICTTGKVE